MLRRADAMSRNNKFRKLAVLSLLGVFALVGCSSDDDEIYAKPSNYKDEIVTIDGNDEKIHNDILKIIYDAMHDGSVASKTLDAVLYRYAQSVFGSYNKITLSKNDESTTLKAAAENAKADTTDKSVVNGFIKAHKAYWTYNEDGKHINDDDPENPVIVDDKSDWTPCGSEQQRVADRWDDIEKRVAENMFSKISSGSYTSKHFFDELKLVRSLYQDNQEVDYDSAKEVDDEGKRVNCVPMILPYTLEGEDVFEPFTYNGHEYTALHRNFYQTNYKIGEDETADVEGKQFHYVEKELIEDIYNDLLIEQYLLDEEVAAVRNSRARLINVIKIEKYSTFTINADLLVKSLVSEIYNTVPEASATTLSYVDEDNNPFEKMFESYANMSKGLINQLTPAELTKLENINAGSSDAFKIATGAESGKQYFEHTTYGDLVEEYEDLLEADSYDSLDKDLYNKYTSNGTTTYEEGFDQEEISLSQTQSITKGWYIQKSAPSLDSNGTITDRLFQLSVANSKVEVKNQEDTEALAELAKTDRIVNKEGLWRPRTQAEYDEAQLDKDTKENKFLCSINGAFFLKFEGAYSGESYQNDIVYDDGSAYYIVQVVEAAKDVKLRNSQSKSSYANTRGESFLNDVIAHVTRKVAETGNYASLAKEHWLKEMSIKYHDQNVYDYFKENYPDLFKDED